MYGGTVPTNTVECRERRVNQFYCHTWYTVTPPSRKSPLLQLYQGWYGIEQSYIATY